MQETHMHARAQLPPGVTAVSRARPRVHRHDVTPRPWLELHGIVVAEGSTGIKVGSVDQEQVVDVAHRRLVMNNTTTRRSHTHVPVCALPPRWCAFMASRAVPEQRSDVDEIICVDMQTCTRYVTPIDGLDGSETTVMEPVPDYGTMVVTGTGCFLNNIVVDRMAWHPMLHPHVHDSPVSCATASDSLVFMCFSDPVPSLGVVDIATQRAVNACTPLARTVASVSNLMCSTATPAEMLYISEHGYRSSRICRVDCRVPASAGLLATPCATREASAFRQLVQMSTCGRLLVECAQTYWYVWDMRCLRSPVHELRHTPRNAPQPRLYVAASAHGSACVLHDMHTGQAHEYRTLLAAAPTKRKLDEIE